MPSGIYKRTEKHKKNISESKKGKIPPNFEEFRKKGPISLKGKKKVHSEETKRKISKVQKGRVPWNKGVKQWANKIHPNLGRKWSNETKKRMSESTLGQNHPNWRGGISRLPYSFDFDEELKMIIRKRDDFQCQICGKSAVIVHHIDYDKTNSNPINLITICAICHGKTNYNRKQWIKYFGRILKWQKLKYMEIININC